MQRISIGSVWMFDDGLHTDGPIQVQVIEKPNEGCNEDREGFVWIKPLFESDAFFSCASVGIGKLKQQGEG